jgi:hypothetical protein
VTIGMRQDTFFLMCGARNSNGVTAAATEKEERDAQSKSKKKFKTKTNFF